MKAPVVIRNIMTLSVLSLVESIHLLFPLVVAFNYFYPLKYDPAVWNRYFPFLQSAIRPNHDFFFYHCWLMAAVAIQTLLVWCFRNSLQDAGLLKRLRPYMLNEAFFLFAALFCAFKIIVWQGPGWAWVLLYAVLTVSWLVRIFWPEARKITAYTNLHAGRLNGRWLDLLMIAAIVLLIFPTDTDSILARDFIYEQFHHFDGVIMGPAWAYVSGCVLNVDVLCQYGLGMTVAVAKLAQAMGGLSYQHVLWIYVYAAIFYFIAAYLLLRFWLGSFLLAGAGVFLSIKFQMFHWGVAPVIWGFLSATVVRYFFDMFFLFFILYHLRLGPAWALWAASICAGISLAYMPDTGAYQWVALCVYLAFLFWEKKSVSLFKYAVLPVVLGLVIVRLLAGPMFWSARYWHGAGEQASLFLNGMGDMPIYTNLSQNQFFAFFLGLFIPLVYVFSMIFLSARWILERRRREDIFAVVLCVYGLGLYHYYVCRSAPTSYHAVDIPFVFILCFWAREILSGLKADLRRGIAALVFMLALGGLMTNCLFTYYPNVFHLAGYDWAKEKAFYQQRSDVTQDVRLIDRLTSPSERVAVIANLDVKITIEAHRKPLLYFFPLACPDYAYPGAFVNTGLFTPERLARTLQDLQEVSPRYVFVDAAFYRGQLPVEIYQKRVALAILFKYLHTYYEESGQQGQYLLALQRRK